MELVTGIIPEKPTMPLHSTASPKRFNSEKFFLRKVTIVQKYDALFKPGLTDRRNRAVTGFGGKSDAKNFRTG